MFQCVLDETQELWQSGGSKKAQRDEDEALIDRVLQEGLRLKRKVKELTRRLAESESHRAELQNSCNTQMGEMENFASMLNATHVVELQNARDAQRREMDELKRLLSLARQDAVALPSQVASLSQTVLHLQDELKSSRTEAEQEISQLRANHESELQQLRLRRSDDYGLEVQRSQLLRRAMIAEAEVERLASALEKALLATSNESAHVGGDIDGAVSAEDHRAILVALEKSKQLASALEVSKMETENRLADAIEESVILTATLSERDSRIDTLYRSNQEQQEVLRTAHEEIGNLQASMDELIYSKDTVEAAVSRVLSDNEELRFKIKILASRDGGGSSISFDPARHYRSTSSPSGRQSPASPVFVINSPRLLD